MKKQFELNVKGRGKFRKEKLALAEITLPLLKVENEETIIVNPDGCASKDGNKE